MGWLAVEDEPTELSVANSVPLEAVCSCKDSGLEFFCCESLKGLQDLRKSFY